MRRVPHTNRLGQGAKSAVRWSEARDLLVQRDSELGRDSETE